MTALTDAGGNVVQKYAYDPWGARRNPDDWTQKDSRTSWILNRGYTGHGHLDAFGVINMNGRVYDPLTAQFLSPDPELQAPGDWLNYNRYSYCFGNPMRYVDPSGYMTEKEFKAWLDSEYTRMYAEWMGRQVGADGLTNEQWLNASRPGADPNLARDYRWQNQSAYNNVMSGMSNGSGFSVSGKSAQNAFRYLQSNNDAPAGGDGVLLPEVRVTGRNGYWNVDEFSLLDAWHAVNDYQFGGSATPGWQGSGARGATVYVENDGIGHVYLEVNGTVFSYGRYDGSYSPSSGRFGPVGPGVLLKGTHQLALEKMAKSPTSVYSFPDANASAIYDYLNCAYNSDTPTGHGGMVIDTYFLIGNNCATTTCGALQVGGVNIPMIQTPAGFNSYMNPTPTDWLKYEKYGPKY